MSTTMGPLSFAMRVRAREALSSIGPQAGSLSFEHVFDLIEEYERGTGASKVNAIYSLPPTVVSSATPVDLRGSLASLDGTAVTFPIVMGIFAKCHSTTPGHHLDIGGGSNPFISWLLATGDGVVLGPGGVFALWSPIDGYATTAGTADILTFTPSASMTISAMIVGRSA